MSPWPQRSLGVFASRQRLGHGRDPDRHDQRDEQTGCEVILAQERFRRAGEPAVVTSVPLVGNCDQGRQHIVLLFVMFSVVMYVGQQIRGS